MKKTQISILGCGWLGLPLAKLFIENNYTLKGSTTSVDKIDALKEATVKPYIIKINEAQIHGDIAGFLEGSSILIINIPPGLRKQPQKNHVTELKHLINCIDKSTIKHVLYVSSTSVFKDEESLPIITAYSLPNAKTNSAKQLIAIEKLLKSNTNFKTTILRFAGLFDADRHPGKFLSGKENIKNPNAPVNLIHKKDCVSLILKLIQNNIWEETFNAANPSHPLKENYYTSYCKTNNLTPPKFEKNSVSRGKTVDASKLVQLLNYSFKMGL